MKLAHLEANPRHTYSHIPIRTGLSHVSYLFVLLSASKYFKYVGVLGLS